MITKKYTIDYSGGSASEENEKPNKVNSPFKKNSLFDNDKIYEEFLDNDCTKNFPLQPTYTINLDSRETFYLDISKQLFDIMLDVNLDKAFIFIKVVYKIDMYHVSGILINTNKKIIEYFDSMTSNQSYHGNYMFPLLEYYFTKKFKTDFKYYGLDEIYGKIEYLSELSADEHKFPPPQNTENQLIGSTQIDDISDLNIYNFIQNYNSYKGGTCIFWTYHVINKVVEEDITIREFIRNAEWYQNNQTYLEIGFKVIKYIIIEITKNLLDCKKSKLTKIK